VLILASLRVLLGGLGLVLNALECCFVLNLAETLRRYACPYFMGFGLRSNGFDAS
jgi:hypothetical protein